MKPKRPQLSLFDSRPQPVVFDVPKATELRDEAITRVAHNAKPEWTARALAAVAETARCHGRFTTDDVWLQLGEYPRERRAMGAVMREAARLEWITPTSEWRLSQRPSCHRRPLRVWVSLREASAAREAAGA